MAVGVVVAGLPLTIFEIAGVYTLAAFYIPAVEAAAAGAPAGAVVLLGLVASTVAGCELVVF